MDNSRTEPSEKTRQHSRGSGQPAPLLRSSLRPEYPGVSLHKGHPGTCSVTCTVISWLENRKWLLSDPRSSNFSLHWLPVTAWITFQTPVLGSETKNWPSPTWRLSLKPCSAPRSLQTSNAQFTCFQKKTKLPSWRMMYFTHTQCLKTWLGLNTFTRKWCLEQTWDKALFILVETPSVTAAAWTYLQIYSVMFILWKCVCSCTQLAARAFLSSPRLEEPAQCAPLGRDRSAASWTNKGCAKSKDL